jgi:hypothetical protein
MWPMGGLRASIFIANFAFITHYVLYRTEVSFCKKNLSIAQ